MKNFRLAEIQSLASAIQMQSVLTNGATKPAENRPLAKFSGKMNWMKLWIYEILILEPQNEEINAKKIVAIKDATYMQLQ